MGPEIENTKNEPFVSGLFYQFDYLVCRAHVSASGRCLSAQCILLTKQVRSQYEADGGTSLNKRSIEWSHSN